MAKVDLLRLAATSRRFLDLVIEENAQCRDPGYDGSIGIRLVLDAAQQLGLALDGRDSLWDSLPETDPNPGVRIRTYTSLQEKDIAETVELQAGVIRSVFPELLHRVGVKDPRECGLEAGLEFDLHQRMKGFPPLLGVEYRDADGEIAGGALKRAVERLEALIRRSDIREYLGLDEAAKSPKQTENSGADQQTNRVLIPFGKALEITNLTATQLNRACGRGEVYRDRPGRGCLVDELEARRYADLWRAEHPEDQRVKTGGQKKKSRKRGGELTEAEIQKSIRDAKERKRREHGNLD